MHTHLQCLQLAFWCISELFSSDVCYCLSEIVFVYAVWQNLNKKAFPEKLWRLGGSGRWGKAVFSHMGCQFEIIINFVLCFYGSFLVGGYEMIQVISSVPDTRPHLRACYYR